MFKFEVTCLEWEMGGASARDRICTLYNEGIGDEFHELFACKNADISFFLYIKDYTPLLY